MAEMHYLDLDLLVTRSGRRYRAHVVGSPAGQADTEFRRPFSDLEIENFVLKVGGRRSGTRRIESPEMEAARQFGQRLFGSAFGGEIGGCFQRSLDEAERQGAGLRVRLHLTDVPELADLPWEYLYNPAISSFLALSVDTPLVRYTDRLGRITPLAVQPPLKVLAMVSSPRDYPSLDVEGEWGKLSTTLGALQQRGLVALERVEPTLGALQQRLLGGQYHVFHFVGHGGFDPQGEEGVLILEDESGRGRKVTAHQLGVVLHNHKPLRLVILNACEGGRASRTDPFAGTAQTLMQRGIPAVIAMQFEISDDAAVTFADRFYSAVAVGYPVDAALTEARCAIFAQGNDIEWGTPVLFLRAPDGRIFDMAEQTDPLEPLYSNGMAAMGAERWAEARDLLAQVVSRQPDYRDAARRLREAEEHLKASTKEETRSKSGHPLWRRRVAPFLGIGVLVIALALLAHRLVGPTPATPTPGTTATAVVPSNPSLALSRHNRLLAHLGSFTVTETTYSSIAARYTGVKVRDFILRATGYNPTGGQTGNWDETIIFRRFKSNHDYRLVLTSDKHWYLYYGANSELNHGAAPELNVSPGGSNDLTLIVTDRSVTLLVNGRYVASPNVAAHQEAGDVALGAGYFHNNITLGEKVHFANLRVWGIAPAYGPQNGTVSFYRFPTVALRDFMVESQFSIPSQNNGTAWRYGFAFRHTGFDRHYVVSMDSTGHLYLGFLSGMTGTRLNVRRIQGGTVSTAKLQSGAVNDMLLIVTGIRGTLIVNAQVVATLDLSATQAAGSVGVYGYPLAQFTDFRIWTLDS